MNRLLVLDNYDSFTFNLVNYVRDIGTHEVDVYRNDAIPLEDVEAYDSVILSPGPGVPVDAGILIPLIQKICPFKKDSGCMSWDAGDRRGIRWRADQPGQSLSRSRYAHLSQQSG